MVSRWRDRAAFTAYMRSDEHRISHDRIEPSLQAAIRLERLEHLRTYDVVADRYFEEFPGDTERYGQAARAWEIHGTLHCLQWAVLDVEGFASIEREVAWLANVLRSRDFPLDQLATSSSRRARRRRRRALGEAHRPQHGGRLLELDLVVLHDLHAVAERVAEVEPAGGEEVDRLGGEHAPRRLLVVDDEPEVPLRVARLRSPARKRDELVAELDERAAVRPLHVPDVEQPAVEGQRALDVVHLQRHVVDADRSRSSHGHGGPR